MGTIKSDSCLDKIRAREGICAICGKPRYHKEPGAWGDEIEHDNSEHRFLDAGDEPIFVLRAQDWTAVLAVQYWMNNLNPELPPEKREEAAQWCSKALAWPKKKAAD